MRIAAIEHTKLYIHLVLTEQELYKLLAEDNVRYEVNGKETTIIVISKEDKKQ